MSYSHYQGVLSLMDTFAQGPDFSKNCILKLDLQRLNEILVFSKTFFILVVSSYHTL